MKFYFKVDYLGKFLGSFLGRGWVGLGSIFVGSVGFPSESLNRIILNLFLGL